MSHIDVTRAESDLPPTGEKLFFDPFSFAFSTVLVTFSCSSKSAQYLYMVNRPLFIKNSLYVLMIARRQSVQTAGALSSNMMSLQATVSASTVGRS